MTGSIRPDKQVTPFLVGVAGGSGSGKSHFVQAVVDRLGSRCCQVVNQDNFYIDQSACFDFDGGTVNFDHPSSLDFDLLADCLARLRKGQAVDVPVYDFVSHQRHPHTLKVGPKPIILVDGILIFHAPQVRVLFDELIFFDTSEDLRFQRRLQRDVRERGRTPEGVRQQFQTQVKPMNDLYVEPSKVYAHTVVVENGDFAEFLATFCLKLKDRCRL